GELQRMRGGETDPADALDLRDGVDQHGEIRDAAVVHGTAVGVDALAQQVHLAYALFGELGHFHQHVVERAADLGAAGVGHHAVAAVLRAAFHDRDEGGGPLGARLGQLVELLDLGEGDVHLRPVGGAIGLDQLGQAVQRLRAEHQVHVGRALDDGLAFLAGHATAHADDHVAATLLVLLPAAELAEHLFLRLLADRAGVDQDNVRLGLVLGQLQAVRGLEHVGHLGRVVLVHLAAVGLDEKLAAHGCWLPWLLEARRGSRRTAQFTPPHACLPASMPAGSGTWGAFRTGMAHETVRPLLARTRRGGTLRACSMPCATGGVSAGPSQAPRPTPRSRSGSRWAVPCWRVRCGCQRRMRAISTVAPVPAARRCSPAAPRAITAAASWAAMAHRRGARPKLRCSGCGGRWWARSRRPMPSWPRWRRCAAAYSAPQGCRRPIRCRPLRRSLQALQPQTCRRPCAGTGPTASRAAARAHCPTCRPPRRRATACCAARCTASRAPTAAWNTPTSAPPVAPRRRRRCCSVTSPPASPATCIRPSIGAACRSTSPPMRTRSARPAWSTAWTRPSCARSSTPRARSTRARFRSRARRG